MILALVAGDGVPRHRAVAARPRLRQLTRRTPANGAPQSETDRRERDDDKTQIPPRRGDRPRGAGRPGDRPRAGADQVAVPDLCRLDPGRARDQAGRRLHQRRGERRDGGRTLLLRPDRADGRAVPGAAARHPRRRPFRRRLDGLADAAAPVRRVFPVRDQAHPRRAGAVQPVRPRRYLARGIRRRSASPGCRRRGRTRATSTPRRRSPRSPTWTG